MVEAIPENARPFHNHYYAITRDGRVYRIEPERGTWHGRRLFGYTQGKRHVVCLCAGGRRAVIDPESMARRLFP